MRVWLTALCHSKDSGDTKFSFELQSIQPFFQNYLLLKREFLHGVTTNSLLLSFSPCKATSLTLNNIAISGLLQLCMLNVIMSFGDSYFDIPKTCVYSFCSLFNCSQTTLAILLDLLSCKYSNVYGHF